MIHMQYKNILLSANTDKHSHDSSYALSIYHTPTEMKYFYTFNINDTQIMFFFSLHILNNLSLPTFAPKVISRN